MSEISDDGRVPADQLSAGQLIELLEQAHARLAENGRLFNAWVDDMEERGIHPNTINRVVESDPRKLGYARRYWGYRVVALEGILKKREVGRVGFL